MISDTEETLVIIHVVFFPYLTHSSPFVFSSSLGFFFKLLSDKVSLGICPFCGCYDNLQQPFYYFSNLYHMYSRFTTQGLVMCVLGMYRLGIFC